MLRFGSLPNQLPPPDSLLLIPFLGRVPAMGLVVTTDPDRHQTFWTGTDNLVPLKIIKVEIIRRVGHAQIGGTIQRFPRKSAENVDCRIGTYLLFEYSPRARGHNFSKLLCSK